MGLGDMVVVKRRRDDAMRRDGTEVIVCFYLSHYVTMNDIACKYCSHAPCTLIGLRTPTNNSQPADRHSSLSGSEMEETSVYFYIISFLDVCER